ncbi:DUF6377 domain-containing protein [Flavobacterium ustbae]|uniref:DUF6377 domain-containing protein n=1 Tax=Flavobacterium ustbae TaxID=2488790 RepID=UPI000F7A3966|nr:DUF6377 domain-containing protein [Flavobacterium ustbae]
MKKIYILIFVCLFSMFNGVCQESVSKAITLEKALAQKNVYTVRKDKKTGEYRKELQKQNSSAAVYAINNKLYQEYRKYKIDSALYFIRQNLLIAKKPYNSYKENQALIELSNLYSSNGSFLESRSILEKIDSRKLPNDLKAKYYEFYSQFFEHYATNNPNTHYRRQIEVYRDSLLGVLDPKSNKYKINLAQKLMYNKKYAEAQKLLIGLLNKSTKRDYDYAMYTYLLGDIKMHFKEEQEGIKYYRLAAVADLENGVKDHGAIQNLAIYNYYRGDIDKAYRYAKSALEDAVFCNVKFRTLMMSEFYSIINTVYQEREEENKNKLHLLIFAITMLSAGLLVTAVYVYRQMKKISKIKEALSISSEQLKIVNSDIQEANNKLSEYNIELHEANRIKQTYIAQFFDMCSSYIGKLDEYRIKLNKKALSKQFEELSLMLRSSNLVDEELQELYRRFDEIFISLYPDFVSDFNNLLLPEERIILKEGEILNPELRIYALERLGFSDSVKIASFLRYSLSTIYNYRTKVRNRTSLSKEEFEFRLQKIGMAENSES